MEESGHNPLQDENRKTWDKGKAQRRIPITGSEIYDAYTTKNLDHIANSGLLCKVVRNATSSYSS